MPVDWRMFLLSGEAALLAVVAAFPLALALGWMALQARWARAAARVFWLLPAPVLVAAWSSGSLSWMAAAGAVAGAGVLARECSTRLEALPAPWFESLRTLGAPAYRAAWPELRGPMLAAAGWLVLRIFLEALAGLMLRGRG